MKIIVTGAAGFIGGAVAEELRQIGYEVVGINSFTEKLPSKNTVKRAKAVLHFGAYGSSSQSLRYPYAFFQTNVAPTASWLNVLQDTGTPFIFASTVKTAPGADGYLTPYGLSKQVCEDYISMYHNLYNLRFIINRMSTVYGPTQIPDPQMGWFRWMVHAAKNNLPIVVNGDGTQSRDVVHVDDITKLIVDQVHNFADYENQAFDIGGGAENCVSINELLTHLNYTNVTYTDRLIGDLQKVSMSNDVTNVRGWKPEIGWKEGIETL